MVRYAQSAAVLVFCAAFLLVACSREASDELPLNEQPMYGYDAPKTAAQLAADAELVEGTLNQFKGSREAATLAVIGVGWTSFGRGDLAASMKRFNQAYLLDPTHGESYAGMAVVVLERGGSTDEAEGLFRRAIASPVITYTVHRNYGLFLTRQNRHLDALAQFEEGLDLNPDAYELRFLRAELFEALERAAESRQELQHACEDAKRLGGSGQQPHPDMAREMCADVGVSFN